MKVVDPGKIRISGGWRPLLDDNERIPLVVGKEKQIPFDASAAGPGELTADVRGPTTKIPTAVETRPGGRHTLVFTPEEEGITFFLLNKHFQIIYFTLTEIKLLAKVFGL